MSFSRGQDLSFSISKKGLLTATLPLILRWSLCVPACPAGMFKASQEAEGCSHCPSNSRSPSEASPICTCRTGYYRADFDPPEVACTSKCLVRTLRCGVWFPDSASGGQGRLKHQIAVQSRNADCGAEADSSWAGHAEPLCLIAQDQDYYVLSYLLLSNGRVLGCLNGVVS